MKVFARLCIVVLSFCLFHKELASRGLASPNAAANTSKGFGATPASSSAESVSSASKEFTDLSIGGIIEWFIHHWKDLDYDKSGLIVKIPGGSGLALKFDWGFSRSGYITDKAFPPFSYEIITTKSNSLGNLLKAGKTALAVAEMISGKGAEKAKERFSAARQASGQQDGGVATSGSSYFEKIFGKMTHQDKAWLIWTFKLLCLAKKAYDTGMVNSQNTTTSKQSVAQQMKYLDVLGEVAVLTLRLTWTLKSEEFDWFNCLESAPEWLKDTLEKVSLMIKKEPDYVKNLIETFVGGIYRYQTITFDDKGNIQNIGPAIHGIQFSTQAEAERFVNEANAVSKVFKGGTEEGYDKLKGFCESQAESYEERNDAAGKNFWDNALEKLTDGEDYRYFGLVDQSIQGDIPAAIQKAGEESRGRSSLPKFMMVPVHQEGQPSQFWALYVTSELNMVETVKLVSAISLRAAGEYVAKYEEHTRKNSKLGEEYKKARAEMREEENAAESFLQIAEDEADATLTVGQKRLREVALKIKEFDKQREVYPQEPELKANAIFLQAVEEVNSLLKDASVSQQEGEQKKLNALKQKLNEVRKNALAMLSIVKERLTRTKDSLNEEAMYLEKEIKSLRGEASLIAKDLNGMHARLGMIDDSLKQVNKEVGNVGDAEAFLNKNFSSNKINEIKAFLNNVVNAVSMDGKASLTGGVASSSTLAQKVNHKIEKAFRKIREAIGHDFKPIKDSLVRRLAAVFKESALFQSYSDEVLDFVQIIFGQLLELNTHDREKIKSVKKS